MPEDDRDWAKPHLAIVGGGIVGVILTLGLLRRKVSVRLYEQSTGFQEIGAGIAFSACARRCMELIDPLIIEALQSCGAVSVSDDTNDLRWVDGYNQPYADDPRYERPLAEISGSGFRGCRRDQFLEELAKQIPGGVIEFRKRCQTISQKQGGRVVIQFSDGSVADVDAVIGCDVANKSALNVVAFLSDPDPWPDRNTMVAEGTRNEVESGLRDWNPTVLGLVQLLPERLIKWGVFDLGEFPAPRYYNGRAETCFEEIRDRSYEIWHFNVDTFEQVRDKFGYLDILVNNAGADLDLAVASGRITKRECWNETWDVNVTGTHLFTEAFAPLLLVPKARGSRVLFITSALSSISEFANGTSPRYVLSPPGWPKPSTLYLAYRASKSGMNILAVEWARLLRNDGVKVFNVSPGFLNTGLGDDRATGKWRDKSSWGALDPAIGAAFCVDVIDGLRDDQVWPIRVLRRDVVQQW
ncbi:Salicylate 1-monooxygenase [Purpureocillium takamizusanense]|uniref:Salicylate 1-monooxygenase n=1 Tax=Purpureocillium takamizusanense TaxID=2060973 RepID=A0A9Q8QM18_9HYPO|nr:Salicylate 1-monooxygenase [Purpureocillium takamizusanense]UNI22110.1 Salicylate 1-monooxygenase [Purpureocillium takamizusanense]